MSSENKTETKGEEAPAATTAAMAVEKWINEVVAPVRASIIAALPRASPEERAVILARALQFLPGPAIAEASAPAAAPAGQAKAKTEVAAPAAAQGAMEPLKPDAGNGDAALSKALEALEWRPAKNGRGEWIFVLDREGQVEDVFARPPLQGFLERVKVAPPESGLLFGGYRYRLNERFLHRWPLRH